MSSSDKINILVVDDLPEKLLVFGSVLADLNENVVTAGSGEEALQQVLQKDFAVILLDVNMPGMDGFETASLIRKRKRSAHVPIIFITAYADELHTAQGYSLGAVDYIMAPVVPDILRTKVQVFVDLFRMTQQVKQQADERIALMQEQAARAAAEESNRRLAFLVKAGNILGRSLDYHATVRDVASLSVPSLADVSAVTYLEPVKGTWQTVLARATENGGTALEECEGTVTMPGDLAQGVERVLAGGHKELLSGDDLSPAGRIASALVLPLQARSQTIGALVLAQESHDRQFGPAEITMVEALASRAVSALDNALLYSDVQRADRQKNDFLSMLAHELRNPLAPIRNAVRILELKEQSDPHLNLAREVIDRQVTQLVRLVDDLLDVSRITRGKIRLQMEPVEVAAVVTQAVETSRPLIDERRHQLSVNLPAEPVRVMCDFVRLTQVLTNLLNNAAKYTDEGGRIDLGVSREEDQVVLTVKDTGVGIPGDMLPSIFELFTQVDCSLDRSQGGLGIGLTLVRHLVQMHGGTVQATSPGPNQGSEFVVRLSALGHAGEHAPDREAPRPTANVVGYRVFLIDDNRDATQTLAMLLRQQGFDVHTAFDGRTALQIVPKVRPDIVLLDIGLPEMNGYEIARRLRQQPALSDVLLVALTGYSQEEDRRRAREAGFDHFFVKPIDVQAVASLLATTAEAVSVPKRSSTDL
jgi:signal transduction histidine kinase/DNA-binding response OmpR family regulator